MGTFLWILFGIFALIWLLKQISSRNLILNCFRRGNVIVNGLRGMGKDVMFSWVVNKRQIEYCSNVDYSKGNRYVKFDPEYLSLGGNTFENFMDGAIIPYKYPLSDGCDFYISDAGVYFPSQEFSKLNKKYPSVALFQALSRHVGDCNFHCNVQNLNRLWDKIREQSDCYVMMKGTKFLINRKKHPKLSKYLNFCYTMKGYVYERYDSAVARVKPMKRRWGRLGKIEYDKFLASYGEIRKFKITAFGRPSYNDRIFKEMLEENYVEDRSEETSEAC